MDLDSESVEVELQVEGWSDPGMVARWSDEISTGATGEPQVSRLCQPCVTDHHKSCLTNRNRWSCSVVQDSTDFQWQPCDCRTGVVAHGQSFSYFTDAEDPRRLPFDPNLDYYRDESGFRDPRVQNLFRNLQIANQMHKCCFTCWKYCGRGKKICRFGFPRNLQDLATKLANAEGFNGASGVSPMDLAMKEGYIMDRTDRNGRKRRMAVPPFNNAHLNNHAFSPLLFIAQRANMDVKFMSDKTGTVEYIGSYISKTEQPDFKRIGDIYVKSIANISRAGRSVTDQNKLNAVGHALIDSQHVGAPQMCFLLMSLPFILYSRSLEVVNPLHKDNIRAKIVGADARSRASPDQSAFYDGPQSHKGRRLAHSAYLKFHMERFADAAPATFYAMRTHYTSKLLPKKVPKKLRELDHPLVFDNNTGFINEGEGSFKIDGYVFSKRKKSAVIHLSPYLVADVADEASAYAILLLHHVWPQGNEEHICPEGQFAVDILNSLIANNRLLPHVAPMLKLIQLSEEARAQNLRDLNEQRQRTEQDSYLGHRTPEDDNDEAACYGGRSCAGDYNSDEGESLTAEEGYFFDMEADGSAELDGDSEGELGPPQAGPLDAEHSSDSTAFLSEDRFAFLPVDQYNGEKQAVNTAIDSYRSKQLDTFNGSTGLNSDVVGKQNKPLRPGLVAEYQPVSDWANRKNKLQGSIDHCDREQRVAFERVKAYLHNDDPESQLLMFVSGEGGTGKSHLIKTISEYAAVTFGRSRGKYGQAITWAPTGSSAFNIGGITWHTGVKMRRNQSRTAQSMLNIYHTIGAEIRDAKLLILDEVSMIGVEDLYNISTTLQKARATLFDNEADKERAMRLPFGGLHVLFVGDLYQLPPVKRTPIFSQHINNKFKEARDGKELWFKLNAYIRLIENHRINATDKLAVQFAAALSELREGGTRANKMIQYLNAHHLIPNEARCIAAAPTDALWLSPFCEEAAQVNKRCFDAQVANGDRHYRCIAQHTRPQSPNIKVEEHTEFFKITGREYGATYLDLAIGSRVRITENLAVELGKL